MNRKILSIQSSPNPFSVTKALSRNIIDKIKSKYPNVEIQEKDISKNEIPHLSGLAIHSAYTKENERTKEMNDSLEIGNKLIREIIEADIIIIGAPMWNLSIPSVLKAYIDQIVRVGVTFKYGENGPEGLISGNKKLIIVSSRGGVYSSEPYKAWDHQETLIQNIFYFLGIKNIEIVTSEGLRGQDTREEAIKNSKEKIDKIIEEF